MNELNKKYDVRFMICGGSHSTSDFSNLTSDFSNFTYNGC